MRWGYLAFSCVVLTAAILVANYNDEHLCLPNSAVSYYAGGWYDSNNYFLFSSPSEDSLERCN